MYMLTKSKKYAKSVPYLQKELPDNYLSDFFHFLLKKVSQLNHHLRLVPKTNLFRIITSAPLIPH